MSTSPTLRPAFTIGAGRQRPQGRRVLLDSPPSVDALVSALGGLPVEDDGWWSGHLWRNDRRAAEAWEGTWILPIDIDFRNELGEHAPVPDHVRARLEERAEEIAGNVLHTTPRGARVVVVLDRPVADRDEFTRLARAAAAAITRCLRVLELAATRRVVTRGDRAVESDCDGFAVDLAATTDLARFYFRHNARVDGVARVAPVRILSRTLRTHESLLAFEAEPAAESRQPAPGGRRGPPYSNVRDAVHAYRRDRRQDWPDSHGACPACAHADCFGRHPENADIWICHSTSHGNDAPNCGRLKAGKAFWFGDALDLDAFRARLGRIDHLVTEGYLRPLDPPKAGPSASDRSQSRAWTLGVGEYEIIAWPRRGRRHSVTLEMRYDGLRVTRDNVDLNSEKSRGRYAQSAANKLPPLLDDAEKRILADLEKLMGLVDQLELPPPEVDGGVDADTVAERLLQLVEGVELFHDAEGTAYTTIEIDGHKETWPVLSRHFRTWLRRLYYVDTGKAPNSHAVSDVVDVLEGRARFDGDEHEVFVRVGDADGAIYLDLGRADWGVVKVTASGWELLAESPVRFRRPKGLLPLPVPELGGSLKELRPFLNLELDSDWVLMQAWLVCALRPGRPMAVLLCMGEQGSAKSTTVRVLRRLLDPNTAEIRSVPKSEHDLVIAARNARVLALDNLSNCPTWLSDAICRIATGAGFGTRKLYSDDEEELFRGIRPVILNGISDVATRGDLLDRGILIYLPKIEDEVRKDEETFWKEFEVVRPRILGAVLDAVSEGLRNVATVGMERKPRMADFAKFGVAAEGKLDAQPGAFMDAYLQNIVQIHGEAVEHSLLARIVVAFAGSLKETWEGTATELLRKLNENANEEERRLRGWPQNPGTLSGMLRRLAPSLRKVGVRVDRTQEPGSSSRKLLRITPGPRDAGDASTRRGPAGARSGVDPVGEGATQERRGPGARGGGGVDSVDGVDDSGGHRGRAGETQIGGQGPGVPPAVGPGYGTTDPEVFRRDGDRRVETPLFDGQATDDGDRDPIDDEERRAIEGEGDADAAGAGGPP